MYTKGLIVGNSITGTHICTRNNNVISEAGLLGLIIWGRSQFGLQSIKHIHLVCYLVRKTWILPLFTFILTQPLKWLTCLKMFHWRWQGCHVFKWFFLYPLPFFCPLFILCRTWSCQSRSLQSSKTCWRGCCREMFPRGSAVRAKGRVHAPTSSVSHIISNHTHTNRCTGQVCIVSYLH